MDGKQTVRQDARNQARRARAMVRQEHAQRDVRLAKAGEQVAVALAERDAMVTEYERRAGEALRSMIEQEGLSATEALAWCGADGLTPRDAHRLVRVVADPGERLE